MARFTLGALLFEDGVITETEEHDTMDDWQPGPRPGDRCLLLGNDLIEHVAPCRDGHETGVITNVRTMKVVKRPGEAHPT